MVNVTCKCGTGFKAKEADIKRGWAKSCSKSCAASRRNAKPVKLRHVPNSNIMREI